MQPSICLSICLSIRPPTHPGHQHSSPCRTVWVAASLPSSAQPASPPSSCTTAPRQRSPGPACPQRGIASQRREEGRGFFQHSDPVFNVTQLCRVHKDATGCALLAVRLMFGNKKTDSFICLIIWCCQEQP